MQNKSVVVFAPHPDDETLGCGGTIAKKVREGFNVYIVFITDGRNSHRNVLNIYENPSPEELKFIRRNEAIYATSILGIDRDVAHMSALTVVG